MVKNKDKWSALSMSERADLIKLYVSNGITSLNDIKKDYNSFDDGGDTKDENKTLGYTTTSQQDLQDIETFNSNWFKYRDSQLANSARRNPYRFKELNSLQKAFPFWVSDDKLANLSRDWIDNRLSSVVETHTSEALKDEKHRKILKEIYHEYFPYGAVDSKTLTPREITDSDLKYIDQLRGGTYIIPDHTIIYADGNQNTTAKIHERLHAAQPVLPYSVDHTPIGTQDGVYFDKYYDSQREIYARLMELRYANKLDPSHTYDIKEVKAMRNDPNFKDSHIFDRYTDEYILMLLNDVAQNNIDENRLDYVNPDNIAAFGGKLNKFETGGPKDSKHVEDVVRTTRGSTGRVLTRDFPFVDFKGAGHLWDSWRVMKGSDKKVAPSDDNYTGTAMKGVGVQTDDGLGFASQQDLANTLGYTPKDFVDTYVYGVTPFEELGVFKKEHSPERHVVRSKVKKVEDSGKQVNTYQTQRDTLDTNTVAALDSLLNAGLVDLRSENTTYQESPFNIGDSGIIYDGNNSTIATTYLPNGMPVSKVIDVFDTDPKEWNYGVGPLAKTGLSFIHNNTNPFLMTTPWYYPIKSTDFLSRLYYLFGIEADPEYNVISNKGDKNGVIWDLHEALEWLDSHPDLTEMPVKTKKD